MKQDVDIVFNRMIDDYTKKEQAKDWLDNHDPYEDNDIVTKLCEYCGEQADDLHNVSGKSPFDDETIIEREICSKCLESIN